MGTQPARRGNRIVCFVTSAGTPNITIFSHVKCLVAYSWIAGGQEDDKRWRQVYILVTEGNQHSAPGSPDLTVQYRVQNWIVAFHILQSHVRSVMVRVLVSGVLTPASDSRHTFPAAPSIQTCPGHYDSHWPRFQSHPLVTLVTR